MNYSFPVSMENDYGSWQVFLKSGTSLVKVFINSLFMLVSSVRFPVIGLEFNLEQQQQKSVN